jgi:AraC-like DNA-binding protein
MKNMIEESESTDQRIADFGLNVQQIPAFSLKGVWDRDSRFHLNTHPAHQVLTVNDGVVLIEDGREKQPLYRNMAAFIPAFTPHRVAIFDRHVKINCESLFFRPDFFPRETQRIAVFEISELANALLDRLNQVNLKDLSEGLMGNCLSLFVEILCQEVTRPVRMIRLPEAQNPCCRRVIRFLEDNFMNKIRMAHLGKAYPLSTRQISRIFQKELGMSPLDYLRLYRLLRASMLLYERERKVIDIAFDCGYQSISSFYKDYNLYYGVPPHRFRQKILR